MKFITNILSDLKPSKSPTASHTNESLKNYLYRSLIADDFLDIYFIENTHGNEIEKKLATALATIFKSEDFENQGLRTTDDIKVADAVIFMLSEHLTKQAIEDLSNLDEDVVKIGFITSAAQNEYDLSHLNNLILVNQGINSFISPKQLKKTLKVSNETKIVGLPLSPFINTVREQNTENYITLQYQPYTAEIGLYELIATSLPSKYAGIKIECKDNKTAQKLANHFNYMKDNVFILDNIVILKDNTVKTKEDIVLQQHATIKLLKIIRKYLEANQ